MSVGGYKLDALTTEGSTLSASRLGPSRWAVGEPSLESVLLSDEFMLVSLTLELTTLAVITCRGGTTVTAGATPLSRIDDPLPYRVEVYSY